MARDRRVFTTEYKQEAVRLLQEGGRPIREVAGQLGIRADLLRRWQAEVAAQGLVAKPPVKDFEAAYRQLQRENAILRQERDFLKKAAAFFAKGSDGGSP